MVLVCFNQLGFAGLVFFVCSKKCINLLIPTFPARFNVFLVYFTIFLKIIVILFGSYNYSPYICIKQTGNEPQTKQIQK